MGALSKVPVDVQAEVWAKKREGLTNLQIQTWLQEQHGITLGIRSVDRLVVKQKDTFKSYAQAEYARFAAASVAVDMQLQGESLFMLAGLRNEIFQSLALDLGKKAELVRKLTLAINTMVMDRANLTSEPSSTQDDETYGKEDYLDRLINLPMPQTLPEAITEATSKDPAEE